MDRDLLDKLRCPACSGAMIESSAAALSCAECGRTIDAPGGVPDFLPPEARSALSGGAASVSWQRWRQVGGALARWREKTPQDHPGRLRDSARVDRFLSFAALKGDVLDVGCKDGNLQQRLQGDATLFGIEPMPPSRLLSTKIVRGVGEVLPFRDATFGAVTYLASFDYLVDAVAGVKEAHRVLRPGGRLLLLLTVRPKAMAVALRARGLAAVKAAMRPSVIAQAGLGGALEAAFKGIATSRRRHVDYYANDDVETLLRPPFEGIRRQTDDHGVAFFEARKP